ncbi:Crp/Fnr family transcriptional regulator [Paracoccus sp. (in: a-proteobacteria)]|uniref:Crp/Fnr family transcriptional regulator n=1 Tax=Paracoccus sp. TaxID=267 RepID=UPI0026DFFEA5|nr:Crp/Fnr family transcriptional regulator [Paracoccus sp. (in: a-proteobacteria)]MDO5371655.1 Crp/Fnr family transcriptional regulator [Paracoccus sp. (in: a-proteobacteria)]
MPDDHPTVRAAFQGLSPAEVGTILTGTTTARLSAGEPLFLQGDPADRFFLLKEGWLKVTQVTADGQKLIVRIVHPGEFFGFAPALQRDLYPGTCEAIVDSEALVWPRRRWQAVLGAAPSVTLSIVQAIGRKLDEAHDRLREMTTEEAARRVARLVLRLRAKAGDDALDTEGGIELPYPLTRQDIADMSGNTLHTVSRIMAAWEGQGVLGRGRRKVVIADLAALQEIAGEED